MSTCCCCINLKSGVVLISLFMMMYSFTFGILGFIGFFANRNKTSTNLENLNADLSLISGIFHGISSLGFLYGLFVICFTNTHRLLRPYVTFTYLNIVIDLIIGIFAVILCNRLSDDCIYSSLAGLSAYIVFTILTTLLLVYFSLVIASYANSCHEKEEMVKQTSDHENITVA
ncbi:hypothetical protein G9A89_004306 [Geosiphon pyriformis]|nr:hypothetical protein G9A89_004306 [Geosiphon pyriformis]